jgi:thiol:disulfide interchange protein
MDFLSGNHLSTALSTGSVGVVFLCFAAGVASSFTPCIYPLIPVTIGILGSRKVESKLKGFLLTMVYVMGIAVTYATLGLVAALTGSLFGSMSSNPWVLIGVAVVIMGLALSMLDALNINFTRFTVDMGSGKRTPGVLSNFAYGLTFGLVASPCTAPPLAAILTWVGHTRSLVMGPLLLFAFALGMGSILILFGTFSSFLTRLPRSGGWLMYTKKAMGYLMILMAGYFVFQAGRQW